MFVIICVRFLIVAITVSVVVMLDIHVLYDVFALILSLISFTHFTSLPCLSVSATVSFARSSLPNRALGGVMYFSLFNGTGPLNDASVLYVLFTGLFYAVCRHNPSHWSGTSTATI